MTVQIVQHALELLAHVGQRSGCYCGTKGSLVGRVAVSGKGEGSCSSGSWGSGEGAIGVLVCGGESCLLGSRRGVDRGASNGVGRSSLVLSVVTEVVLVEDKSATVSFRSREGVVSTGSAVGVASGGGGGVSVGGVEMVAGIFAGSDSEGVSGMTGREAAGGEGSPAGTWGVAAGCWAPLAKSCAICRD